MCGASSAFQSNLLLLAVLQALPSAAELRDSPRGGAERAAAERGARHHPGRGGQGCAGPRACCGAAGAGPGPIEPSTAPQTPLRFLGWAPGCEPGLRGGRGRFSGRGLAALGLGQLQGLPRTQPCCTVEAFAESCCPVPLAGQVYLAGCLHMCVLAQLSLRARVPAEGQAWKPWKEEPPGLVAFHSGNFPAA